jgi:acyl-[acyl-carrier-protein]-phospholipid O-acyltransferase/long-chain-fatty-acid--[acyl-carrier-protein] ligase
VIGSLFGPIKYGILPDHLARSELPAGNALVEGATFIAILLGLIVGGMAAKDGGDPYSFALLMIMFSLLCWGASLFIPPTGEAAPDLVIRANVALSTYDLLRQLREDRRIGWGALVTSWFWLVGAVAVGLLVPLVKNVLGGTEEVGQTCLAIFSISIAVGAGLAAWLAAGRIILLPTLIGAVLLGLFSIDLGWSTSGAAPIPGLTGYWSLFTTARGLHIAIDLAGIAVAGGLFIVPTFAAVQAWAGADRRAAWWRPSTCSTPPSSRAAPSWSRCCSGAPGSGRRASSSSSDCAVLWSRCLSGKPCRPARSATRCRSSIGRCSASR